VSFALVCVTRHPLTFVIIEFEKIRHVLALQTAAITCTVHDRRKWVLSDDSCNARQAPREARIWCVVQLT
jgi:hypothetical protein